MQSVFTLSEFQNVYDIMYFNLLPHFSLYFKINKSTKNPRTSALHKMTNTMNSDQSFKTTTDNTHQNNWQTQTPWTCQRWD
jgi:hypothetical protein